MDNNELIALFHKELREDAEVQGYTREKTEHVIRHISMFGERGFILSSNVNENNAREVIKSELNYFKNLPNERRLVCKFSHVESYDSKIQYKFFV